MKNQKLIVHLQSNIAELKNKEEKFENRILEMERKNKTGTTLYANLQWAAGCAFGEYSQLEEIIKLIEK